MNKLTIYVFIIFSFIACGKVDHKVPPVKADADVDVDISDSKHEIIHSIDIEGMYNDVVEICEDRYTEPKEIDACIDDTLHVMTTLFEAVNNN